MRIWLFALSMITALMACLSANASPFGPTGCRINPQPHFDRLDGQVSNALTQVAEIVRAKERKDQVAEIKTAREVATSTAKLYPQDAIGFLYVIEDLRGIGGVSYEASLEFARTLTNEIDPTARQQSEMDIHPISAYLKALEWILTDNSENWNDKFKQLETSVSEQGLCIERIYFLHLAIAEHIGVNYTPEAARQRLQALIEKAERLSGTSVNEIPMKWYGYQRLTATAATLCLFDLALPMLKRAQ